MMSHMHPCSHVSFLWISDAVACLWDWGSNESRLFSGRLFSPAQDNFIDILRKWRPQPSNTGNGAVNDGYTGDLRRYPLK